MGRHGVGFGGFVAVTTGGWQRDVILVVCMCIFGGESFVCVLVVYEWKSMVLSLTIMRNGELFGTPTDSDVLGIHLCIYKLVMKLGIHL